MKTTYLILGLIATALIMKRKNKPLPSQDKFKIYRVDRTSPFYDAAKNLMVQENAAMFAFSKKGQNLDLVNAWINKNIRPIEREFDSGERGVELLNRANKLKFNIETYKNQI